MISTALLAALQMAADGQTFTAEGMAEITEEIRASCPMRQKMQAFFEAQFGPDEGFTELFLEMLEAGLLVEIPPTPEHLKMWGPDEACFTWAWKVP